MQKLSDIKIFVYFLLTFIFFSCNTVKTPHSYIDYSDISAVMYQAEYTQKLLKNEKFTEALVRSEILARNSNSIEEIEELKNQALKEGLASFIKATEKKDWETALKLFRSLSALNKKPEGWTEQRIFTEQEISWKNSGNTVLLQNSSEKNENIKHNPKTTAEMIKGTVTVWVDRGMRIEKGMGYSDIVIGSGFFIDKRGYFITNYHVIESEVNPKYNGYSRLYIKSPSDPNIKISAKVVGWDPLFDLALVKTEIVPEAVFDLGSSKKLEIGSRIYAIGSPAGLEKTLTSGIVSAKYRRLFSMVDVLQIDAAVNHGNSGGPIVDEQGLVQAIVFAGLEQHEGLNFAIPVELLKNILPALYSGGMVKHSWLGGFANPSKTEKNKGGIEAAYIIPDGPLALSGIKEGSIITHVGGIEVKKIEDIQSILLEYSPETIIKIEGYKKENGEYIKEEWPVLCMARPDLPGREVYKKDMDYRAMLPVFGFYLESSGRKKAFRILSVIPGSFADETGFTANDYIELNGKKLNDEDEEIIHVRIYAKKLKAGYVDTFMVLSAYLDNPLFF